MKSSSARQEELDFDFVQVVDGGREGKAAGSQPAPPPQPADQGSAVLAVPNFGGSSQPMAIAARLAGRLNASTVSESEFLDLHRERQNLLDKKFANAMTRREELRLQYVRWTLDRIEDARTGMALDELETAVGRLEQLQADIRVLEERILEQVKEKVDESRRRPQPRQRT